MGRPGQVPGAETGKMDPLAEEVTAVSEELYASADFEVGSEEGECFVIVEV